MTSITPEQALLMAVLDRAIQDSVGNISGYPKREKLSRQLEARGWVNSLKNSVYSFVYICDQLGFDAESMRQAINKNANSKLSSGRRTKTYPKLAAILTDLNYSEGFEYTLTLNNKRK